MKKNRTTTPAATTTADAASPSILTLDTLREMETGQRVDLYVTTENRQRLGFLLQGKILHTLGTEGTELLRTAGIKPSSLCNARRAEWVLRAFTEPDTDTLRNARFHVPGVDEPVEFSEALYNTLTLRQCELLQIGFTTMGTHRHRPTSRQMSEMLTKPNWDDHVECFLDCGTDLDGKAAREAEAAEALAAEARRREEMQRQIDEQAAQITALQASGASALPPPPPMVNTAPAPAAAETADADAAPDNVVAFPTSQSGQSRQSGPTQEDTANTPEPETTQDEPETTDIEAATPEPETTVTHEEIASAVADATEGMENYNEDGPTVLTSCLDEMEDALNDGAVNQCSVEDLNSLLVRLDDITAALRTALVAKAAPQDELPAAQPKAKGGKRSKKAALAAA
jgi:hypothetical protein